jgi:hypothetical protein
MTKIQGNASAGHGSHGGGAHSGHFHLPMQGLLGITGLVAGVLFILGKLNIYNVPFISDTILAYICAVISVLGGFHMIISKIWRPRIYL